MAIQPMNDDVQIIQHLSDNPNQDDGLSAVQMKEKFDAASVLIKAYLNGTLVPAVQHLQKALNNGEIIGVDDTLSIAGKAADAKATGDALGKKADTSTVDAALAKKADTSTVDAALAKKADTSTVDAALAKKAEYVRLWANASRDSAFAAQTLAVNTKGYDYLLVVCGRTNRLIDGQGAQHVWLRTKGSGDTNVYLSVAYINSSNAIARAFRHMTVPYGRTEITFDGGYASDGKANDEACIPYYIYGIKGVNNP